MPAHYITWWNLENLFDVENSTDRPAWLASSLKNELKGWTKAVLERKLDNLASVLLQINQGNGPDILGVCEVENKHVLDLVAGRLNFPNRNYKVLHQDTGDQRGIDIAYIYDANKYLSDGTLFSYEVMKRGATRDLLQVTLKTQKGNELILIGNHWPSRSGGQYSSEPYRMMVGETLSYWLKRIHQIKGGFPAIVLVGDFNDEPFNRSLTEYALSSISRDKVVRGRNPYLFNLMWPVHGERKGSYVFGGEPLLIDQVLVSKGIAMKTGKFNLDKSVVAIEHFQGMTSGIYNTPVRFGRPSTKSSFNQAGFSDHLPVSLQLWEK